MTEQEKKFADEYVLMYFHSPNTYSEMAIEAAITSGYSVPKDVRSADDLGKTLLEKPCIRKYIDSEIKRFREILSDEQRRNLWKYISDFKTGTSEKNVTYGNITVH